MPTFILQSILQLSYVAVVAAHEPVLDAVSLLQLEVATETVPGGGSVEKPQHELVQAQARQQNRTQPLVATKVKQPYHGAQRQTKQQEVHSRRAGLHNNFSVASALQTELELLTFSARGLGFWGVLWFWILAPIFICTGCFCCCCWCSLGCLVAYAYYQIKGSITELANGISAGAEYLRGEFSQAMSESMTTAQKAAKTKQILNEFFDKFGADDPNSKPLNLKGRDRL
mmetsp:Transcript_24244/g.46025  ORF Transcript_24244/g.46025 Transcript_24244/m.46025 type:complete len:228 (-) Transcript_24244:39-722(-)